VHISHKEAQKMPSKLFSFLAITAIACSVMLLSVATPANAQTRLDKYTKVAIVPTVDASGVDPDTGKDLAARTNKEIVDEFTTNSFTVIDDATVTKATTVDMTDEDNETKDNLYKIGERAGADVIVFVVMDSVNDKESSNWWAARREAYITDKIWCLNVKTHQAFTPLNGKKFTSSSKHQYFAMGGSGDLKKAAARDTIYDAFKDFFNIFGPSQSAVQTSDPK
jgi:hypothetical protein